jgi:hypothetical protein
MAVYTGSTPKYLIRIRDLAGNQLDPSNSEQVSEVRAIIYNAITGIDIARFRLKGPLLEGEKRFTTKAVSEGDVRILMVLTSEMTKNAHGNANEIQLNVHIPDDSIEGGMRIEIRRGKFHEVYKAKE